MRRIVITRFAAAAAPALLLAACGGSGATSTPRNASAPAAGTQVAATPLAAAHAPCVPAAIHTGAPPGWTAAAWADSSPGFRMPYSLTSGDPAAAFWFAPRLRAGHPENPSNKVLWVVRFPRDGQPLEITARLAGEPGQVIRISRPPDSSPGEIYPSEVDLPKPGCWMLQLSWGSHRASINVQVHSTA